MQPKINLCGYFNGTVQGHQVHSFALCNHPCHPSMGLSALNLRLLTCSSVTPFPCRPAPVCSQL